MLLIALAGVPAAGRPADAQPVLPAVTLPGAAISFPSLPWPPPLPGPGPFFPAPPGTPPFLPPVGPAGSAWWPAAGGPAPLGDLADVVAALQQVLDLLAGWAGSVQHAASDALVRVIWEAPGHLPQGTGLPDLIGRITLLPPELQGALEALRAKLGALPAPGSPEARHQAYAQGSPPLAREAAGVAAVDEIVTSGAVAQDAAVHATSLGAQGAARDLRLPAAVAAGYDAGDMLLGGARELPSTRAGVELLVAGMGMGMRQQADLGAAVADRLTVLAQQTAEVSQQIGALAATAGALAAREAERDRQALDARLGLADALAAGGSALQQMLADAGGPASGEIRVDPLY
jgi:hypothetical protein